MLLVSAKIGPFKSIEKPTDVKIEKGVTALVGMNEAGKTVFMQALEKSEDVFGVARFDSVDDYPRKNLNEYERRQESSPDFVSVLTYELTDVEVESLNKQLIAKVPKRFQFSISHNYNNEIIISLTIDHKPVMVALENNPELSVAFRTAIRGASKLIEIPTVSQDLSLTDADKKCLANINDKIAKTSPGQGDPVYYEVCQWLSQSIPKFMYFGDYEVLPSIMNLADLKDRIQKSISDQKALTSEHRGVLALLRMANITIDAFANPGRLETLISRIEAVSIRLTDQIMEFWKQNEDLEVRIDIRPDQNAPAPYNNGPNLYIRIANNRHRGVTTPFRQRSRGFIWFFSFLVWFDSVQQQLAQGIERDRALILLLDEPGLSLHALAQGDFLRYIDNLAARHQVIYSTHSPFMIHSDRLHEIRVVEDRDRIGTVISDNVSWTDERTIFPLQAALGWTIAQNLFISERNLLVEGSSDLIYLQVASSVLESRGKGGQRSDITIVPAGGLDKVVTFIAILGANKLKIAVFHDYHGAPDQKLLDVMREKMIPARAVLDASQFRQLAKIGVSGQASDTEDLFEPASYLRLFNDAYARELSGTVLTEADLPPGNRIVDRIERYLAAKGIKVRATEGFNHYLPATTLARDPSVLDPTTLARFEALFKVVNSLF